MLFYISLLASFTLLGMDVIGPTTFPFIAGMMFISPVCSLIMYTAFVYVYVKYRLRYAFR